MIQRKKIFLSDREEKEKKKISRRQAVIVAQLAERSLPTPEIRGLNTNIDKKIILHDIEKTKIKKKGLG